MAELGEIGRPLPASGLDGAVAGSFGLRDLARTLLRRRRVIVGFAAAVMAVVVLGLLTQQPSYEAHASILVKKGAARVPLTPQDTPVYLSDMLTEEDINTEIGILSSRVLLETALRAMDADAAPAEEPPAWRRQLTAWKAALRERLGKSETPVPAFEARVDKVRRALTVEALPKSNIIALRFVGADPEQSQRFLDALMDSYQHHRASLYEPLGAETFFRDQAAQAAAKLEAAEAELQAYLGEAGVTLIDGPEGQDVLEAEKRAMLNREQDVDQALSEARAQERELRSLLRKTGIQLLAEAARVRTDLVARQRSALLKQQDALIEEAAGLEQELVRLRQTREQAVEKLGRIRKLEDRLRGLLLKGQGAAAGSAQLKREVDQIYSELAELGQLRRYDLNTGQDTSVYQFIENEVINAEVELSGIRERAARVQDKLAQLAAEAVEATADANVDMDTGDDEAQVWQVIERTRGGLARSATLLDIQDRAALSRVFEDMVSVLVTTEGELEGVQARVTELEQQSAAINARLVALNHTAARAKTLRRELARAERAYNLYRRESDSAAISAAMSREELVNTSVAQPPSASSQPVGPGKVTLLLVGLFVAGAGGAGLALLLGYLDHSIATPEELERRLGLLHLASVREGEVEGPLDIGLAALGTAADVGETRPPAGNPLTPLPALADASGYR